MANDGATVITGTETASSNTQQVQLPALPENWISGLPAELQSEESLKLFKDIPTIAKSLVHAQKQVGTDKIPIPSKHATESDWMEVYKKLGLPSDMKEYKFDAPKDLGLEGERLEALKQVAYKAGVMPKQLQALLAWSESDSKNALVSAKANMEAQTKEGIDSLKKEWGEAYNKKVAQASFVIKQLKDDGLVKYLEETGLGNNPNMIKVFARLGDMFSEGKLPDSQDPGVGFGAVRTPDQAKKELTTIQGNFQHPYYDAKHPGHELAVKEVHELTKQAYPGA